ncbi:MAG: hypothetical protein ACXQS9_02740 [Methermicoccaceae archaeon]
MSVLISLLAFAGLASVVLVLALLVSTYLALVVLFAVPAALVFFAPPSFLYERVLTVGEAEFTNIHVLLVVWGALLGFVIYSELLGWYLRRLEG